MLSFSFQGLRLLKTWLNSALTINIILRWSNLKYDMGITCLNTITLLLPIPFHALSRRYRCYRVFTTVISYLLLFSLHSGLTWSELLVKLWTPTFATNQDCSQRKSYHHGCSRMKTRWENHYMWNFFFQFRSRFHILTKANVKTKRLKKWYNSKHWVVRVCNSAKFYPKNV